MKFEEEFPSLNGENSVSQLTGDHASILLLSINWNEYWNKETIQEHCLDKAKVKDAILKITSMDYIAEYPANKAGMVRVDNSNLKMKLLKELGL